METKIFDEAQLARQRSRHADGPEDRHFLFDKIIESLQDRLSLIRKDFPVCARIGARGKPFQKDSIGRIFTCDIAQNGHPPSLVTREDFWPFKRESLDLIIGAATLHTVNDLPGTLIQCRQSLKPDGLFLAAIFGGDTLSELRQCFYQAEQDIRGGVSPRVAPFADMRQIGALMQRAGFALPVVDSEKITVTYDTMFNLMRDLRQMGEANALTARQKTFTPRSVFLRAADIYKQTFAEADGRIPATFEIIYMLGWAPHEAQQKPLRPGSATSRLSDMLGTDEIPTGEKL